MVGQGHPLHKGWERNFVPKKFRGIDSEQFPLFRGKKCSFRGIPSSMEEFIPSFTEELIPKLGMEWNYAKNISFTKKPK
jgi:hypothetical protein